MFIPQNEQGLVSLFFSRANELGWSVSSVSTRFPDAILEKDGVEWRVEFEYKAKTFITHKHDYRKCDIIICWINNLGSYHIPVYSLSDNAWTDATGEYKPMIHRKQKISAGGRHPGAGRIAITAWGDEADRDRLDTLMREWGCKSRSETILMVIERRYKQITGDHDLRMLKGGSK